MHQSWILMVRCLFKSQTLNMHNNNCDASKHCSLKYQISITSESLDRKWATWHFWFLTLHKLFCRQNANSLSYHQLSLFLYQMFPAKKSTCGDKRPTEPRNWACVAAPNPITTRSLCRSRAQDSHACDRDSPLIESRAVLTKMSLCNLWWFIQEGLTWAGTH